MRSRKSLIIVISKVKHVSCPVRDLCFVQFVKFNSIMEVFGEEFQFTLEMVILNRNENGATLMEIRGNFTKQKKK